MPPRLLGQIAQIGLGLLLLVGLVVAIFYAGRCTADEFNQDQPPEVIPEKEILENLDFGPEIPLVERPFKRRAPVRRAGEVPEAARADVDSFVAAAQDSSAIPEFIPFRGSYDDDHLILRVPRSDGTLVMREFDCPERCDFGAQDTTLFGIHPRALPRFLPEFGKDVAQCAGIAGLAAAVAWGVNKANDDPDPLVTPGEAAIGGGALCAGVKLVQMAM